MKDFEFPTPPEQEDVPLLRRIPRFYYWWFGAVFLLGITIIWLPSQCSLEDLNMPAGNSDDNASLPVVNQEEKLEFRKDGLWYVIDEDEPYTGVAEAFHENGKLRSSTKIKDGKAYGLIREWDENGTSIGPRFKDEF